MKNDRFLTAILVFIVLLVVAALALFVSRDRSQSYLPEDGPEDVIYNYALALSVGDFEKAYSYLADGTDRPTPAEFRRYFSQFDPLENAGLRIGEAEIVDDEAFIGVTVVYGSSGPFDPGYSYEEQAFLVRQNGVWRIRQAPYPFWDYDWLDELRRP